MKEPNQNKTVGPKPRVGLWYAITAIIVLLFVIFFVVRGTAPQAPLYTDADMVSTDVNGVEVKGKLYEILNEKQVTYLNVENHDVAKYYYLEGQYVETAQESQKQVRRSFQAKISSENDEAREAYFYIINHRMAKTSEGQLVKYYSETNPNCSYNVVDYSTKVNVWSFLPSLLIWALIIGLGIYMVSKLNKSMGAMGGQQMQFNQSRARRQLNSKVKFKDVAGCDEVKAELVEMVDYFKNAKKYTALGAKLPKGVLLVGPPGTGKTLLAKAVAGEANVPFYSISGSDFVEMYVGVGAGRVRDMFKVAKENAPCLVFIDEIDAVGRQRGAGLGGGNDEREQTLNQLLVEMDGFEDNSGVIIMAATNRSDVLDPALLRAGRFDRQITVDLPDKEGREAILKVHARNKVIDKSVDFAAIASRTVGFSGADLANILNDAAILAVRANRGAVIMSDIDEAIDRAIAGPAKSNRTITEEEKRRIAFHESGHAVIGLTLPDSDKVQKITIIPRGRTGGHVLMTPENDRFVLTKNQLLARITGLLGGRTSEEIFFGDVSTGASNDIERATEIARDMVTEYGMSDLGPIQYEKNSGSVFLGRDYSSQKANYSTQIAFEIDTEVRKIIDQCHEECTRILKERERDVRLIASTLIDKETITAEEISYLLEHGELPPAPVVKDLDLNADKKDDSSSTSTTEEAKPVEETKPTEEAKEVKEEKTVTEPQTEVSLEAQKLKQELKGISEKISLICLFVEDDNGKAITTRTAKKIIKDSTVDMITRSMALGQEASEKLRATSSLFVEKELWTELASSTEEFGHMIEDESGVEVVLIKCEKESFKTIKEDFSKKMKAPVRNDREQDDVASSLKDLVNQDEKDKEDK